jgi:hypothetical protein
MLTRMNFYHIMELRDSTVGIATGYWLDDRGRSSSPSGVKNFHISISSRPALGLILPPIQRVPGALSPGVKRQGREADHSPPSSAEVKKTWIYTYIHSLIRLHGDNFTLPYGVTGRFLQDEPKLR